MQPSPAPGCPVCEGTATSVFIDRASDRLYGTTSKIFSIVRCRNCGLARLSPRPSPGELSSYYPAQYWFEGQGSLAGRLEELYRRIMVRDHVRFARRALGSGTTILDVGCGTGLLLRMLRRPGVRAFGIDLSSHAAGVAWRRNGVAVAAADPCRAPFADAAFSLITMVHVLEHLPNPRLALGEVRRLLAPQGRLMVQVPNLSCWQVRLFGSRWNGLDVPRHLYDFRFEDLKRLLEACGFRISRVKHFSWRDNPSGLATTIAPALDPVARSVRGRDRSPATKLMKDLAFAALVAASLPFAAMEAVCGHGSSVMVEARVLE